jgi:alpha-glucosidase
VRRTARPHILLALIALAGLLASRAPAQVVSESLGDGITRFFADEPAREHALPSYALEREIKGGPAPAHPAVVPAFSNESNQQVVRIVITPGTSLYGTGEVAGPLLRNGRTVTTWNTDAYGYADEGNPPLYQSHPWVLAVRADGSAFGVLADTTYRCTVDTAATSETEVRFAAAGPAFPIIIINRASPQDVLKGLASITGKMPMPPLWAIGYHQCRYSYFPESRVREVASEFRKRQIPCDVIWFDIDYMDHFRIFTFNHDYFPDPKKLNQDLLSQGFHNVWMIDPGVKVEDKPGVTNVYDIGTMQNVWVKTASGEPYKGDVWPGACHFPDFTDPAVRCWWAGYYREFMMNGITGVWNDMNEPAVFNVKSKTMPEDNRHHGDPTMDSPSGSQQGLSLAAGDHARYHNVYGMQMVRATREGIAAANQDKRPFVLSRANYIGGQRYAATWTGDNTANWLHLEMSIPMVLNVGLSGQPFIGPDIGGFNGNGDAKLFARWMGIGALLPFSRGHTEKNNMNKEPWALGPETEATCREALNRRYRLMPYFYTIFHESSVDGQPVARPLFFADPKDPALRSEDDAFLIGSDVLVLPQVVPDRTRAVTIPRGVWREIEHSSDPDLPKLLVRPGAIVPMGPTIQHTGELRMRSFPLTLVANPDERGHATGQLYEDAGDGLEYQKGEYTLSTFELSKAPSGGFRIVRNKPEGTLRSQERHATVRILLEGKEETLEWTIPADGP